jgi:hypothetical protein
MRIVACRNHTSEKRDTSQSARNRKAGSLHCQKNPSRRQTRGHAPWRAVDFCFEEAPRSPRFMSANADENVNAEGQSGDVRIVTQHAR